MMSDADGTAGKQVTSNIARSLTSDTQKIQSRPTD